MNKATLLLLAFLGLLAQLPAQQLDLSKFENMKARSIGPAGMSGRVTTIDVVLSEPDIIYVGTASGGLWKSESGGTDWKPIFDEQKVLSIGAVAIAQNNPDVIWAGTGEGNPRNSQSSGYGVYRSLDGGRNWQCMGLEETHNIHRILIDPQDFNTVYVGAQGPAWGESEWRGVFKTTDAGETWNKILYVDETTGIADLVMDPVNPNKLIAAMWQFRRWPWFFNSGGAGSGLHVTFDGGKTWQKRTEKDGLPKGELGRIGLAIAPSQPNRVYALVEAKKTGLYKSDDGGFKWSLVNDKDEIGNRPFYYADIYVDSKNENRLYSIFSTVALSEDAGKSFRTILPYYGSNAVHPDHHAWWVHPEDPDYIIEGNDGGMAISRDRGKTWRFVENLPLAQFYHINIDNEWPYNVYGGMQDNGSWKGPAYVWRSGGIRNSYWQEISFGDGFDVSPDPENSRFGYSMSQGGSLYRYDAETGEQKILKPVAPDSVELRFHWNAGLAQDPFDVATIYYGSQFLHKSTDRGDSWSIISPDLSTNDSSKQKQAESGGLTIDATDAENHTTILAISPSPIEKGVIWVGTDDGNVQLTQDGGENWSLLNGNFSGMPDKAWVPQIHASNHEAGEAFVVVNNYRQNDWKPYLFHTRDFGKSWESLVNEDKVWGYCLSLVQDPVAPNLLFLGTEYGLYVSIDYGQNWSKWTHGFPTVSTIDMKIHPREHDLVIGTFGRAAYVLDDIRPLRQLAREGVTLMDKTLHVFDPSLGVQAEIQQPAGTRFGANAMYSGDNRQYGTSIIGYWVKEGKKDKGGSDMGRGGWRRMMMAQEEGEESAEEGDGKEQEKEKASSDTLTIEIFDADQQLVRTLKVRPDSGFNKVSWDLRRVGTRYPGMPKPKPGASDWPGERVLPGQYTARFSFRDQTDSCQVQVVMDPRIEVSMEGLRARLALRDQLEEKIRRATAATDRLNETKSTLELIQKLLGSQEDSVSKSLNKTAAALQDSLKTLKVLFNAPEGWNGLMKDPDNISNRLMRVSSYLGSSYDAPGPQIDRLMEMADELVEPAIARVNRFFAEDWKQFREAVEAANPNPFKEYEPLE